MGEFLNTVGTDDCYRKINVNYCLCKNKFKHNKGISYFPISSADNFDLFTTKREVRSEFELNL